MLHTSLRELAHALRRIPHHLHEVWRTMTTGDKIAITGLALTICGALVAIGSKLGTVETKQDVMAADVVEIKTALNEIAPRKVKVTATAAVELPKLTVAPVPATAFVSAVRH